MRIAVAAMAITIAFAFADPEVAAQKTSAEQIRAKIALLRAEIASLEAKLADAEKIKYVGPVKAGGGAGLKLGETGHFGPHVYTVGKVIQNDMFVAVAPNRYTFVIKSLHEMTNGATFRMKGQWTVAGRFGEEMMRVEAEDDGALDPD